jgi:D-galactarolactone cycloisomerase
MKITEIRATGLRGATPEGGWSEELRPDDSVHTIVAVHTDEGVTGVGSVFTNVDLVRGALATLEHLYAGENALEPERVSEKLRQHMFWFGRGGSVEHAISGVDIALWDILGKATGQPVGRLLGGRYRTKVRPYASIIMREPGELAEMLTELRRRKFRAFKIGWGPFGRESAKTDEAIVAAARKAIGDDGFLMVDAGGSAAWWHQGYKWALRTAQMLAEYGVDWFEEALKPDAIADYRELRLRAPVPISAGEVLTRRQGFEPWITSGALDIIQPDVTKCGGISEFRRVAWMAEDHGVRTIPHGWNTAVGLAADLQLASAFADTDFVEYLIGSPYIDELPTEPWTLDDDGMLAIPDGPGLGIELNPETIAKYGDNRNLLG